MLGIFLDSETTGLDPNKHRIIDIAIKFVSLINGHEQGSYQALVKISSENWKQRDLSSIEINGYSWDEVSKGKDVGEISADIIRCFQEQKIERGKAVFICQNPSFDRGFFSQLVDVYTQEKLNWPYHWLDFASMYWALLIHRTISESKPLPHEISLSKNSIARQNNLPEEPYPHRALNGVDHLIKCYTRTVGFV